MHKLHFSPKCISYTPLLYGISYNHILAYVTPPQGMNFLLLYVNNSFPLLYICVSYHLTSLTCALWIRTWERVGETWRRLWERDTWRVRTDLGEPKWFSVCINYYYQRYSSYLSELLHSLMVLCISTEQLISNRRRIWLGFPLVCFSLALT